MTARASPMDLDAVEVLVECMEDTGPLSAKRLAQLRSRRRQTLEEMLEEAIKHGPGDDADGTHPAGVAGAGASAFATDLGAQAEIATGAFARYLDIGETPPPAPVLRIAIILRVSRQRELERRLLAAWCKHFASTDGGAMYAEIIKRYRRLDERTRIGDTRRTEDR